MTMKLSEYLGKMCYYTQNNYLCETGGFRFPSEDEASMVGYVVACFIAQNTLLGSEGVEHEIVMKELTSVRMSEVQWICFFVDLISLYNNEK